MEHVDVQIRLPHQFVCRADLRQEGQRFRIAPHHRMLTIVDGCATLLVLKGVGPAAELRTRFEKRDRDSPIGECDAGAETGKTTTDNGDRFHVPNVFSCERPQAASARVTFS